MTDEEKLANEYTSSLKLTRPPVAFFYDYVKEAYLAGLKAGRPKWHKVADGDLPVANSLVLDECCDKVNYTGEGKWKVYSEFYEKYIEIEPPIVWCELLEFDEVEGA